jgi:hypothetical protein
VDESLGCLLPDQLAERRATLVGAQVSRHDIATDPGRPLQLLRELGGWPAGAEGVKQQRPTLYGKLACDRGANTLACTGDERQRSRHGALTV